VALVAGTGMSAVGATAHAAVTLTTVRMDGSLLYYEAAPGQANIVTFEPGSNSGEIVIDDVVPLVKEAGCTAVTSDATKARCTGVGSWRLRRAAAARSRSSNGCAANYEPDSAP